MQTVQEAEIQSKELNEDNDCAIMSLSQAVGKEYREVAELSYKLGRKKGRGTPWKVIKELMKEYNMIYVNAISKYKCRPRAWWFLKDTQYVKETIVVSVRGHMFVAKQGKAIWGLWKDKSLVRGYYIKSQGV